MASTEVATRPGFGQRVSTFGRNTVTFYHDVVAELKKVTWPDKAQVRQLSIGVIVIALFVGGIVALLDVTLQQLLVNLPQKLFGG